jgi:predicted ATPase
MHIKSINIANFKSFHSANLELGRFNVLIGPNASGKSNFIQVFKFLREIISDGLDNAISLQGGVEYIRNLNLLREKDMLEFRIKLVPDDNNGFIIPKNDQNYTVSLKYFEYLFKLTFKKNEYSVSTDKAIATHEYFIDKYGQQIKIGSGELILEIDSGNLKIDYKKDEIVPLEQHDFFPAYLINASNFKKARGNRPSLLIETIENYLPFRESVIDVFSNIPIYDIDPKHPKLARTVSGKSRLEENAENMAIVLRRILLNKDDKRKFLNIVNDILPYVENVKVEDYFDRSLIIKLKETFSQKDYMPAFLMSSGTIFIIALIIALYFEDSKVAIFEEPERRIHPSLISKVVDMMLDVSGRKQIILSTHNPEIVKYAGLENLLFVSRNEQGFSTIERLEDKEKIKTFLENEVGIEELYVQNLLDI